MRSIELQDTTLRDGEQAPGFSMLPAEKLEIADQLERMRVDVIEAGFPAASAEDFAAVKAVAKKVENCKVASFCRASRGDIQLAWDAVKKAASPRIHIFLATSDIHLEHKLHMSREQLLEKVADAVAFARSLCPDVQFSSEDATRTDPDFLALVARTAAKAGARLFNLCDTVGYLTPSETYALVQRLGKSLEGCITLGMHCHNDLGMAVANTLEAVRAGAGHIECTINGIGERAGMAAMEEVVMALKTRPELYGAAVSVDSREFYRASKLVASIVDTELPLTKPITGANAFAHEAGIHQHGMMANALTYEIMKPEDVGVNTRMVMGKHSGKTALRERIAEIGYSLDDDELEELFARFKTLADKKKTVTDQDIESLISGKTTREQQYKLASFVVNSGTDITATAVVRLLHGGVEHEHVARGETPVIAAFKAVDKIIKHSYPLHSFTIQSISGGRTELGESVVRVQSGDKVITGRGIDTDIVEACIKAYLSAINKAREPV